MKRQIVRHTVAKMTRKIDRGRKNTKKQKQKERKWDAKTKK